MPAVFTGVARSQPVFTSAPRAVAAAPVAWKGQFRNRLTGLWGGNHSLSSGLKGVRRKKRYTVPKSMHKLFKYRPEQFAAFLLKILYQGGNRQEFRLSGFGAPENSFFRK
jgi:hypothetical protein